VTLHTHASKIRNENTCIPRGAKLFLFIEGTKSWDHIKWSKSIDTHDHSALVFKMEGVVVQFEHKV